MSKRIASLDVLGEVRRAQRILRRVVRYLEQQERAGRRTVKKRIERNDDLIDDDELGYDDQP